MACNKWIPSKLTLKASEIPIEKRIEYMVHNALQPIPEHKFDTIYFYLFNQPFKPSLFGPFSTITELIASKPNLYRTISNDGRPFIHSYHHQPKSQQTSSTSTYHHHPPQWSIKPQSKQKIYGKLSIICKIYKNNIFIRDIDLTQSLFSEPNKVYISFGRDNETDFCLQHQSISRKHCIFQFGNDGTLFIYDISTHGIHLNHKPIPKKKYVELKHKDILRFGHSTRTYHLFIGKKDKLRNIKNNNKENEMKENEDDILIDIEKEQLRLKNMAQNDKINQMQKMIEKLTVDLNSAQKTVSDKSKQVISLMEQMECLNVTNSNREKRESLSKLQIGRRKQVQYETEEEEEEESEKSEEEIARVTKIKGIDFVKEIDNLSRLTVVKLKYYVDTNNLNVGRVKKSELIKIIKKDIKTHVIA